MKCPYCQAEMEKGCVYGTPRERGMYWLPDGAEMHGMLLTPKGIERNGGFVLGKVTRLGFFWKEIPYTYHCPACRVLLSKLDDEHQHHDG